MNIVLMGYGKTGKLVEEKALLRGHKIINVVTRHNVCDLSNADMCIDFSHPEAVLSHVKEAATLKKNIVIGTTGWHQDLQEVEAIARESQIGLLYSPNFSIGVMLFKQIVAHATDLMQLFDYDIGISEIHHKEKLDAPSGTALAIRDKIYECLKKPRDIAISAERCGFIPGTHTVLFDSPNDSITLTHSARNRENFASGAIFAAEWLIDKQGIYKFDDLLKDIAW